MKQHILLISLLGLILSTIACVSPPADTISQQDWKLIIQQANKKQPANKADKENLILLSDKFSAFLEANAPAIAQKMDHVDPEIFKQALKFASTVSSRINDVSDPSKIDLIIKEEQTKNGGPSQMAKFQKEISKFSGASLQSILTTDKSESKTLTEGWAALHRALNIILNDPMAPAEELNQEQQALFDAISKHDWRMIFLLAKKHPNLKKDKEMKDLILYSDKYTAFVKANAATIVREVKYLDTKIFIDALNFAQTLATKINEIDDPNVLAQTIKEEQAKYGGLDQMNIMAMQLIRVMTTGLWLSRNNDAERETIINAHLTLAMTLGVIFMDPAAYPLNITGSSKN